MRADELLSLRNFGRKSYDELKDKLIEQGFLTPAAARRWDEQAGAAGGEQEYASPEGSKPRVEELPAMRGELGMIAEAHEEAAAPDGTVRDRVMSVAIEEVTDHGYRVMLPGHLLIALLRQPQVYGWLRRSGQGADVSAIRGAFHEAIPPSSLPDTGPHGFIDAVGPVVDCLGTAPRSGGDGSRVDLLALRLTLREYPSCRDWLAAGGTDVPALERALAALSPEA
jgi:hypothetical protein